MTTAATKTLSAAQLSILAAAAERPNRMALPLPAGLRARGAAKRALLTSLLESGLLEEYVTEDGALSWRQDGRNGHHTLQITASGLAAVGHAIGTDGPDRHEDVQGSEVPVRATEHTTSTYVDAVPPSDAAELTAAVPSAVARPRGKLGQVLDAVAAEDGATLAELATLTGWQPHTTRAALTGLRRRGFMLALGEVEDAGGRKAYRLRREVPA